MEAAGSSPPCGLCRAPRAPYTCPRCRRRLCSVPCYRAHGACARDFQRRELHARLQGQRQDPAAQRRLREALLRLRELREPGDADLQPGLGPERAELDELWERLGPEERRRFQRLLDSGEISALLPPWRPWWAGGAPGAGLVQELGGAPVGPGPPRSPVQSLDPSPATGAPATAMHLPGGGSSPSPPEPVGAASDSAPPVPGAIPPLSSLTRSPASPLVRFQVPSVLYAYAYALALHHGDVEEAPSLPGFCEAVLDVSGALGARQGYRSTAEALQAALQAVAAGRYPECLLGNTGVLVAVAQILMGECQAKQKGYALAALAHLARLLGKGRRQVPPGDQPRLYAAKKKCDFLLSWVNENEGELTLLALEVQKEYKAHLDAVKEVGAVTQELEKMWGGKRPPSQKTLIKELD